MKWVAAAAAVVVVALAVLLWQATRDETVSHADSSPPSPAPAPVATAPTAPPRPLAPMKNPVTAPATDDAEAEAPPPVYVANSPEMWDHVDETYKRRWDAFVVDCYKGGADRSAKLKINYTLAVQNHVVSLHNIQLVESTLNNADLQDCMMRSLADAHFSDNQMPDYESPADHPEEMVIRMENLKRFLPPQENGMQ